MKKRYTWRRDIYKGETYKKKRHLRHGDTNGEETAIEWRSLYKRDKCGVRIHKKRESGDIYSS